MGIDISLLMYLIVLFFSLVPIPEVEDIIAKQKPQAQVARPKTSRTFVNFERAKKQQRIAQVSVCLLNTVSLILSLVCTVVLFLSHIGNFLASVNVDYMIFLCIKLLLYIYVYC